MDEDDPIKRLASLALLMALDALDGRVTKGMARVPFERVQEALDLADQAGIPWRKYRPKAHPARLGTPGFGLRD